MRDAILLELGDKRIPLCAPACWSDEYQAVVEELRSSAERASLAVQVVGAAYGSRPEGADRSLPELHFDLLEEVARERPLDHPLVRLVSARAAVLTSLHGDFG